MSRRVVAMLALVVSSMFLAGATSARELQQAAASAGEGERPGAREYFTDVVLVNQDGEEMRLYSDIIKGRTVVINAFFSTCKASCPATARTFRAIQDWLGERLGRDVYLISVTLDPDEDTPAKLKRYADALGAKAGWYFLTGTEKNVELAQHRLGQYVKNKASHSSIIVIGNDATGLWKKAFSLASPKEVIEVVASVVDDAG